MEKRRLGRTEMEASVLSFGGSDVAEKDAEVVERLLRSAFDVGINVIDTAECYEHSEELIGKVVGNRRDQVFLFTKCGHPRGIHTEDWSRQSILETIERSLRRLRTDRIDLIQLHGASETVMKRGEAIAALETAREKGLVRYLGYSGDSQDALYAVQSGAFDTLQTSINIADQEAINSSVPAAREKRMGVIAKRPLANVAWKTGHKPMKSYHHEYWERLRKLNYEFLRDYLPEASIAIALRFTLTVPGVHTAIIGTSKPERWVENANMIANGSLDDEEFQAIRERWQDVAPRTWIGQP
jgi:Predicted oxidoreductases (related to aryl-alcohol dehydrogenases)